MSAVSRPDDCSRWAKLEYLCILQAYLNLLTLIIQWSHACSSTLHRFLVVHVRLLGKVNVLGLELGTVIHNVPSGSSSSAVLGSDSRLFEVRSVGFGTEEVENHEPADGDANEHTHDFGVVLVSIDLPGLTSSRLNLGGRRCSHVTQLVNETTVCGAESGGSGLGEVDGDDTPSTLDTALEPEGASRETAKGGRKDPQGDPAGRPNETDENAVCQQVSGVFEGDTYANRRPTYWEI